MIRSRKARVIQVKSRSKDLEQLVVKVNDSLANALNYPCLTGHVQVGDEVILNTTAVWLGLGTGGYHFVMAVPSRPETDTSQTGHIMKMRYTPFQVKCNCVEEPGSPFHSLLKNAESLENMPVVVGSLHSQLGPAVAAVKAADPNIKVAYIMTDGGALPLAFSNQVAQLKAAGLIDVTVTCGHAFGGDLEAVNVYSGLLAARLVAEAGVAVACMGPGIVGTETDYGFTGIEQGQIVDAVNALRGIPIAVPRISFAEARKRHYGLSRHTIIALGRVAQSRCTIVLPFMETAMRRAVLTQIMTDKGLARHTILERPGTSGIELLSRIGIELKTMGKGFQESPEFFAAASAAGEYAAERYEHLVKKH